MRNIKLILTLLVTVVMISCGTKKIVSESLPAVTMSHINAGGKPLAVITPVCGAHYSYISHRAPGFSASPSQEEEHLHLAVAAAFTGDTVSLDVCGYQVVEGVVIKGYDDVTATGHALIAGDKLEIYPKSRLQQSLKEARESNGYLFEQCLIVDNGKPLVENIPLAIRQRQAHIIYRALCLMNDGSATVVQGEEEMYCQEFLDALVAAGAKEALYLDMGTWAWGWYRDMNGTHELARRFDNTRFQTNWLIINTNEK